MKKYVSHLCIVLSLMTARLPAFAEGNCVVEMDINNTSSLTDDVVRLRTSQDYGIPCRARVTQNPAQAWTVVLTNPDGKLRFDRGTAGLGSTDTLTLPTDGSWVPFYLIGYSASASINDASVVARKDTSTGTQKGTKSVTVFWFDNKSMEITVPANGNYTLNTVGNNVYYNVANDYAVGITAKLTLKPFGLNANAPQISCYRLTIEQNAQPIGDDLGTTKQGYYVEFGPPVVWETNQWLAASVIGQHYNVPSLKFHYFLPNSRSCDTVSGSQYTPFVPGVQSLNTNGETTFTYHDEPEYPFPGEGYHTEVWTDGLGQQFLTARYYKIQAARYSFDFRDWAILADYNGEPSQSNLRARSYILEADWKLDVDSTDAEHLQYAEDIWNNVTVNEAPVDSPEIMTLMQSPSWEGAGSQTTEKVARDIDPN